MSRSSALLVFSMVFALDCNGASDTGGGTGGAAGTGGAGGTGGGGTGGAPAGSGDPAIAMIQAQIDAAHVDRTKAGWRTSLDRPALATFTAGKSYLWTLVTSKGEMRLKLLPEAAPMHVTSTIYLTLLGFYDTLTFHRIIKGFMAQGGDPLGNGRGSPGYAFSVEASPGVKHDARGVLSMANAGANTEGSQFFITFAPQPALDGKYSVFGNLISGMDALSAIEAAGTPGEGTPGLVTITSATVSVE
jgi:peptidyl-prolyl cis-trans isomerase B (cyclophilin B)